MNSEESLQFVEERLRHNHSHLQRELHLRPPTRVRRRFVVEMESGSTRRFEHVDASVLVRCERGGVWITHDGDPKDIILDPRDSYRAEREDAMNLFALQACVLEIEFEDAVTEH